MDVSKEIAKLKKQINELKAMKNGRGRSSLEIVLQKKLDRLEKEASA